MAQNVPIYGRYGAAPDVFYPRVPLRRRPGGVFTGPGVRIGPGPSGPLPISHPFRHPAPPGPFGAPDVFPGHPVASPPDVLPGQGPPQRPGPVPSNPAEPLGPMYPRTDVPPQVQLPHNPAEPIGTQTRLDPAMIQQILALLAGMGSPEPPMRYLGR